MKAWTCLVCILACCTAAVSQAKLFFSPTPPQGWNTWNQFNCNITEQLMRETAQQMVKRGLLAAGYNFLNIDDCWQASTRDAQGRLQADPVRFPSGIRALADYVHSLGLKLGIYSDVGEKTCAGYPGTYEHWQADAQSFSDWHVDFLKFDTCNLIGNETLYPSFWYQKMSDALSAVPQPILFSICNWGQWDPWTWAPAMATMWRTTLDIFPYWAQAMYIMERTREFNTYASPGHFNDPDMLEVGVDGYMFNQKGMPKTNMTERESQAHFSIWAMLSAPLILGLDLTTMPKWASDIVLNTEVIAVDQDPLVKPGVVVATVDKKHFSGVCPPLVGICTRTEVWSKTLTGGAYAVLFFNRADAISQYASNWADEDITVTWQQIGLQAGARYRVRDLWAHEDVEIVADSFTALKVPPHGVHMYKLTPA